MNGSLQGVARSLKELPEIEHVKSQGSVLERGDLTISLQPITAQNNLYGMALLRPGTVLSYPAYKYPKMADFWSEEREENLNRLLEEQPVLYDVGMLLRHCGGTWCGVLKRLGVPY